MTSEIEIAREKYTANRDKAVKSALSHADRLWIRLSEAERNAIYLYTDRDINYLINNHIYNRIFVEKEIVEIIEDLDGALSCTALPEDMILFRGVQPTTWRAMKLDSDLVTPGKIITLKGFTSSTYDQGVAYKYAAENASVDDEIAVLEILAPKGTKAAAIENYSQSKQDFEVLINRGTSFKVIEAREEGNITRLIWEVVT